MFKNAQDLTGCAIGATDGVVGEVEDLYFDDQQWTVRYLVVVTGAWLNARKVLIHPRSLGPADWSRRLLPAEITMQQVRGAPDIDTNKPVSRQHETLFLSHYRHPRYWQSAAVPTITANPSVQTLDPQLGWSQEQFARAVNAQDQGREGSEQHLRSSHAVLNYAVRAEDADIGHVQGLLFAEEDWAIRYLVVRTGHWWHGRQILLAVQWIRSVSWLDSCFTVDLSRETLRDAPLYDPHVPLSRAKEIELFKYFGRTGYWHPG